MQSQTWKSQLLKHVRHNRKQIGIKHVIRDQVKVDINLLCLFLITVRV